MYRTCVRTSLVGSVGLRVVLNFILFVGVSKLLFVCVWRLRALVCDDSARLTVYLKDRQ